MALTASRLRYLCALLGLVAVVTLAVGHGARAQEPGTYTVARDDSLPTIASRFGVPLDGLLRAHGLGAQDMLYIGHTLLVPMAPVAEQHVIAPGETLDGIAARYGVATTQLAWRNGLLAHQGLFAGRTLAIPDLDAAVPGPQAIIVRPAAGQRVGGTVQVSGWGQSYDNELLVQLHDQDGALLVTAPAAIHAEIGQLGAFAADVTLPGGLAPGSALQLTISHRDRHTGDLVGLDAFSLTAR
jgi:LysM repeat protein